MVPVAMFVSSGLRRVLEVCVILVDDCRSDVSCMIEYPYGFVQDPRLQSKVAEWVEVEVQS